MTMPPKHGTVVCDEEKCVIGNYKPTADGTAHQRLAKAADMENPRVAGSIKPDGSIGLRSESINRTNGMDCDASGTSLGEWAEMKMAVGDLETTKSYKSGQSSAGPLKKDGTPDRRYKSNR